MFGMLTWHLMVMMVVAVAVVRLTLLSLASRTEVCNSWGWVGSTGENSQQLESIPI